MNNNIITQLINYLTHGWQNPLPAMGQTANQTGQQLYNTFWGQPPATPTPTPHQFINSPWKSYGQLPATLPSATPTSTPNSQVLGSQTVDQQRKAVFQKYGIAPAVAFGIGQAEGGRIGQNNQYNLNATDANPTGAYNYQSPQQGWEAAAQTMRHILDKQGVKTNDPNVQIEALEKGGYAGDPTTWKQRSLATGGAGKQYNRWSDFVKATNGWQRWVGQ